MKVITGVEGKKCCPFMQGFVPKQSNLGGVMLVSEVAFCMEDKCRLWVNDKCSLADSAIIKK